MFLKGKTALISGSTSGIGLAYAKALAAEGASLMVNGFASTSSIEEIQKELTSLSGSRTLYHEADMSKPDEISAMVKYCHDELGGPEIVIANAGIQHVEMIDSFPIEKWDQMIAINLSSAFHLMRTAIPHMKEKRWGRIIVTASVHSLIASPYKSAYVATKHALAGLVKTVALEVATFGITANCISPGYVWTPLVENQIPQIMETRSMGREEVIQQVLLGGQPTGEFVDATQVASVALFLCRDEAAQITGANYTIDGGYTSH